MTINIDDPHKSSETCNRLIQKGLDETQNSTKRVSIITVSWSHNSSITFSITITLIQTRIVYKVSHGLSSLNKIMKYGKERKKGRKEEERET